MESAIYQGDIFHQRVTPTQHSFTYSMSLFWLKLNELPYLSDSLKGFSAQKRGLLNFRYTDYFVHKPASDSETFIRNAKDKMQELGANAALDGDLFFLGQIRGLGVFFSPVNFYFHRPQGSTQFDYMLAEVSNTPWNQRHYYLVNMDEQADTQKAFHVSPFNPIDMTYKWKVQQPNKLLRLALSCHQDTRHFTAAIAMQKQPLNQTTLNRLMLRMPSTALFSLLGIYWQALKLFIKGTPVYGHPGNVQPHAQEKSNVTK